MIVADIAERLRQERLQEEERDRLEGEMHKASDELGQTRAELKALSAYLINTQEQERRRLARELHDDLGQRMALLNVQVDRALKQFRKDPREAEKLLQTMSGELSKLNLVVREVSHRLHPSILEDLGLLAAMRNLVQGFRSDGNEVSLKLPDEIPALSTDTATALFRIAQEALRNTAKHAPGAPIQLAVAVEGNAVELTIRDDGPGFDLSKVRLGGGLGILSMNERARLVNGTLLIKTHPGDGTVVTVRLPIQPVH